MSPFSIGVIGSLLLVAGAAWPVSTSVHPARARKNQLYALGNIAMFAYALLRYFEGGEIFFIFLQILIAVATILMMLNTDDRKDAPIIACAGCALVVYSLYLSMGQQTLIFVVGLCILGVGFTMKMATVRRQIALGLGSSIIAWFSYLAYDPVFLWLNVFFAVFSFWHAWKLRARNR